MNLLKIGGLLGVMMVADATAHDGPCTTCQGVRNGGHDEILLQGFHWNSSRTDPPGWYSVLAGKAAQIGADGFSAIWMPVPWRDTSNWSDPAKGTSGGGEGYYWNSFDKNSAYGREQQLNEAVAALTRAQVKLIYDAVPNHMDRSRLDPALKGVLGKPQAWRDGCAQCDDGDPFMAGEADLNTGDPEVSAMLGKELLNLRDHYGAAGLRFDFVRGYGALSVDNWMRAFGNQAFCVGELWKSPAEYPDDDPMRQQDWLGVLKAWSDRSHCTVFDFALKERLQKGSVADWAAGLNSHPDPAWRAAAVTFVDNHDTGYSPGQYGGQHHWALPEPLRDMAYAWILSSPGTPSVYWPDMYDWPRGALLRELIKVRRSAGIQADSSVAFVPGHSGLVAEVAGQQQVLFVALGSDLDSTAVPAGFSPVLDRGDKGAIRLWQAPAVQVQLTCEGGRARLGESVYAVGSGAALGEWDPARAVRLDDVSDYPRWRANVRLAGNVQHQWKCIVRSDQHPDRVIRWQEGSNTQLLAREGASSTGSL